MTPIEYEKYVTEKMVGLYCKKIHRTNYTFLRSHQACRMIGLNTMRKKVYIIHTGGTIGMAPTEKGYAQKTSTTDMKTMMVL